MQVADEKMLVKTKLGTLVAYYTDDDERPGIYIDLRRPGLGVDAPVALIECDENGELKTRVWGNANFDDATECITHEGISKFFTCFGPGGEQYEYPIDGE